MAHVLLDHPAVRAAALGRVVVTAWHSAPEVDVIAALEAAVEPHHLRFPDGGALVVVPSKEQPTPEARKALQAFLERQGDRLAGATALLAVTGIKGSLLRTAAKGVIAAMRLPFPIKLSASAAEAATQVIELLRARGLSAPSARELERFIEHPA
ncbi:MAG: hypothetical protein U0414_41540 [Polyangiaceae bacterium]